MSLFGRLTRAIEQAAITRERLRQGAPALGRANLVDPAIIIVTAAIEAGHTAADGGDPIELIAAIKQLEACGR